MKLFACFLSIFLFISCINFGGGEDIEPYTIRGSVPVYSDSNTLGTIESQSTKDLVNAGKIYYYNEFIFINENLEGIHIFDNSDPENSEKIGFIAIPGNKNVAVKGDYLYANNYSDLVVIDISDVMNAKVIQRFQNQLGENSDYFPLPIDSGPYLCPTSDKFVIGWIDGVFQSNECHKIKP